MKPYFVACFLLVACTCPFKQTECPPCPCAADVVPVVETPVAPVVPETTPVATEPVPESGEAVPPTAAPEVPATEVPPVDEKSK